MVDSKPRFTVPEKITMNDAELINQLIEILRPFDYLTNLVSQNLQFYYYFFSFAKIAQFARSLFQLFIF